MRKPKPESGIFCAKNVRNLFAKSIKQPRELRAVIGGSFLRRIFHCQDLAGHLRNVMQPPIPGHSSCGFSVDFLDMR